ncbi:MAG: antitoxin Xre/MbcA/ParS toxin-binding domain-containing protein [Verrucomicrobiota bacterium]
MSNTKTLRRGAGVGELTSLLTQLNEKKGQVERLLARVEGVLRGATASGNTSRATNSAARGVTPARKSPLDQVKAVMESAADLREANGNLSAARTAKVFGVSLSQLAGWLGRTKQAVSKTPDADSLQETLGYFERVARLRLVTKSDAEFRKWLRMPHPEVDGKNPLELLVKGEWQAVADFVDDILTGTPG